ncbi:hypothetical protein ACA910_016291 [Epithemia clementina (nom. ined.)]
METSRRTLKNHPSSTSSYRAAMALNNMAVSLLEKGCPVMARIMLGDAVTWMQHLVGPSSSTSSSSSFGSSRELPASQVRGGPSSPEVIFQDASRRYSYALRQRLSSPGTPSTSLTTTTGTGGLGRTAGVVYQVETMDHDNFGALRAAVQHHPDPSVVVVFPIRFSGLISSSSPCGGCNDNDTTNPNEIKIAAAQTLGIVLYNLGLVNYVLASFTTSSSSRKKRKNPTGDRVGSDHHSVAAARRYLAKSQTALRLAKSTFLALFPPWNGDTHIRNDNHPQNVYQPQSQEGQPPVVHYYSPGWCREDTHDPENADDSMLFLWMANTLNVLSQVFQLQGLEEDHDNKIPATQLAIQSLCASVDQVQEFLTGTNNDIPNVLFTTAPSA